MLYCFHTAVDAFVDITQQLSHALSLCIIKQQFNLSFFIFTRHWYVDNLTDNQIMSTKTSHWVYILLLKAFVIAHQILLHHHDSTHKVLICAELIAGMTRNMHLYTTTTHWLNMTHWGCVKSVILIIFTVCDVKTLKLDRLSVVDHWRQQWMNVGCSTSVVIMCHQLGFLFCS